MTHPKIEIVKLDKAVVPDLSNINKHTQRGRGREENSMRRRGFYRPIAAAGKGVETPVVGAGNQTLEIASEIGLEEAIIVHTTGNQVVINVRDDLAPDSAEFHALNIEDNATAEYNPDVDLLAALAAGNNSVLSALKNEDRIFGNILDEVLETSADKEKNDNVSLFRLFIDFDNEEDRREVYVKLVGIGVLAKYAD